MRREHNQKSMSGNRGRDGIKVVIINTQYVQTDATSFKSVVQNLTGKDSKVPDSPDNGPASRTSGCEGTRGLSGTRSNVDPTVMMRNLSFKELDRLMKEMPTIEDLDFLWTE